MPLIHKDHNSECQVVVYIKVREDEEESEKREELLICQQNVFGANGFMFQTKRKMMIMIALFKIQLGYKWMWWFGRRKVQAKISWSSSLCFNPQIQAQISWSFSLFQTPGSSTQISWHSLCFNLQVQAHRSHDLSLCFNPQVQAHRSHDLSLCFNPQIQAHRSYDLSLCFNSQRKRCKGMSLSSWSNLSWNAHLRIWRLTLCKDDTPRQQRELLGDLDSYPDNLLLGDWCRSCIQVVMISSFLPICISLNPMPINPRSSLDQGWWWWWWWWVQELHER